MYGFPPQKTVRLYFTHVFLAALFFCLFPIFFPLMSDVNMSSWGQQTPVCEKTQLNLPAAAPSCVHMHPHTLILTVDPVGVRSHFSPSPSDVRRGRLVLGSCERHLQILADINHDSGVDHHNLTPLSAREDFFLFISAAVPSSSALTWVGEFFFKWEGWVGKRGWRGDQKERGQLPLTKRKC